MINKVNAAAGAAMRYGARLPTFSIRIPRGRDITAIQQHTTAIYITVDRKRTANLQHIEA